MCLNTLSGTAQQQAAGGLSPKSQRRHMYLLERKGDLSLVTRSWRYIQGINVRFSPEESQHPCSRYPPHPMTPILRNTYQQHITVAWLCVFGSPTPFQQSSGQDNYCGTNNKGASGLLVQHHLLTSHIILLCTIFSIHDCFHLLMSTHGTKVVCHLQVLRTTFCFPTSDG